MFNINKFNIAISMVLAALLLVPVTFAADSNQAESKDSKESGSKDCKEAENKDSKDCKGLFNLNINTDWLRNRFSDDSPENIKMRSAPGDPVAGKDKSQLCQGCHGEFGMTAETMIPNLAGQYAKYIAKELRNFQSGARTHQIMNAMAATIDDHDLADIAAYFSSQPKMAGDGSGDTNPKAKVGKNLFLNGDMNRMVIACTNCHGVAGKGRAPHVSMFPVIGGQQPGYLRGQLINWRSAQRANSPNAIMNRIAKSLTDAEIDSLAEYISAQ
jgi:cytochrome c553